MIFVFAHCAEYRTSTMPSTSFICRHHAVIHHASVHILSTSSVFASALSQFAPAAGAFSFSVCAFASSLSACAAAFLYYFSMISWYLFSSSDFSTSMFFPVWSHLMFCHVVFSSSILVMVILSRHGDRESRHDTSVVTSHVDHVVGFGVFIVSQVSSHG